MIRVYGKLVAKMMGTLVIEVFYQGREKIIESMVSEQGTDLLGYDYCGVFKIKFGDQGIDISKLGFN